MRVEFELGKFWRREARWRALGLTFHQLVQLCKEWSNLSEQRIEANVARLARENVFSHFDGCDLHSCQIASGVAPGRKIIGLREAKSRKFQCDPRIPKRLRCEHTRRVAGKF